MTDSRLRCPRVNHEACTWMAIRSLLKDPGVAILAAGSLGIGLGLTAALASVADATLFRPLPVPRPAEIVRVFTASPAEPLGFSSYPDFDDLRRAARTVAMVAQTQILIAVAPDRGEPAQVRLGLAVSADYFDVLGVAPAAGRMFRGEESRAAVVVLAYSFWKSRFGGDRGVIGRTVLLSGTPFTVIGVAPENFGLDRFVHEDFYVAIQAYDAGLLPANGHPTRERARRYLGIYARLRQNTNLAQARAEIGAMFSRLEAEHPESNRGRRAVVLEELDARMQSDHTMRRLTWLLMAIMALIVAITCANAAGLLLLRAETRAAEIAIKLALGATRVRLLAESLAASAALSIAGLALAIPLARAAEFTIERVATLPSDIRFAISPKTDLSVLCVTGCAAVMVTVAAGCAPAFVQRSGSRWRDVLVICEIALASALVCGGGMLESAISSASRIDPGFRADHVLTMALDPAQVRHDEAYARAFYDQVMERVGRLRGVSGVALAQSAPLGFTGAQRQIEIAGEPERSAVWMNIVTPEYFDLLHIPLVAGRGFDRRDSAAGPPVAVVNEELAKRCGVGARLKMNGRMVEVIGVARNAKYLNVGEAPRPFFYLPFSQNYSSRMVLHAKTEDDAGVVTGEIRAIDPMQPVSEVRFAMDYLTEGATFRARVALFAIGVVGICGLGLALAGLYGVVARSVAARRREIGIRIALGAEPRRVARLMLARAARLALMGTVAGLIVALASRNLLAGLMAGARGSNEFLIAPAIVFGMSVTAAWIPSRRAARIDPARLLRQ